MSDTAYEIDQNKLNSSNVRDLHETAELKIHELIDKGEEHRVQWGKLLETFAGLDVRRIVAALQTLTPNQIASIKEGIDKAEDEARARALKAAKANLVRMGISIEDFADHLGLEVKEEDSERLQVEEKKVERIVKKEERAAQPQTEKRITVARKRYSAEAKAYAEELFSTDKNLSYNQVIEKVKIKHGEELAMSTVYAIKKKVKESNK